MPSNADEPDKKVFFGAISVNPLEDLPQIVLHVALGQLTPLTFQVWWQIVAWPLSHYPLVKVFVSLKTITSLLLNSFNRVDLLLNQALDSVSIMISAIPATGEKIICLMVR